MTPFEKYWRTEEPQSHPLIDMSELRDIAEAAFEAGREVGDDEGFERGHVAGIAEMKGA